ncbi:hypothetical protein HDV05_003553 [Chytridiales sp. JEL 0842]|nr:hypothetical protein HDV05_003553 [Chytridiales sp. JEL 0842]
MDVLIILPPLIQQSIQTHQYSNAIFLSERLVASSPHHPVSHLLLAKSYFHAGKKQVAYNVLKGCLDPESMYLMGVCCFELGKLQEAEKSLMALLEQQPRIDDAYSIDMSAVYCMLGQICRKENRTEQAQRHFQESLKLNPFMWTAFENLCQLGHFVDPEQYFNMTAARVFLRKIQLNGNTGTLSDASIGADLHDINVGKATKEKHKLDETEKPAEPPLSNNDIMEPVRMPSTLQTRSKRTLSKTLTRSSSTDSSVTTASRKNVRSANMNVTAQSKEGKSTISREAKRPRTSGTTTEKAVPIVKAPQTPNLPLDLSKELLNASETLLDILNRCGRGCEYFYLYNTEKAIAAFESLPLEQYNTGWVLSMIARSYFEKADYKQADRLFRRIRQLEPFRTLFMDVYSSTLWHLRQEVPLSYLAHELVEMDPNAPETWCAVGNTFSIKNEHESAIKCFNRAIQLNSSFAYAHNLAGHEYIALEDPENAQNCFRAAIRADKRHYNAWYGLGYLYFRQEKFDLSEYHFRKALSINSNSPILTVYIGAIFEKKNQLEEALAEYQKASKLRPDVHMYPFRSASMLLQLNRCEEALAVLEPVKHADPAECNVHFLLGKIYKKMGKRDLAIRAFTMAQDSSGAKISASIKEEIDKLHMDDAEE